MLAAVPAAAQGYPAVNLACTSPYASGTIEVNVYPGAALSGYAECTVSNPNVYIERVEIRVEADGLVVAAPGMITLGNAGESSFQVVVRADQRMPMSSRNLEITATVVEANGAPPPTPAPTPDTDLPRESGLLPRETPEKDPNGNLIAPIYLEKPPATMP